ncbi:MAG: hypothetical protein ABEJ81_09265 [Haloferacaceae archaeon]
MELRACYFCGSPGDGLDTYPLVPGHLADEGSADDRVVLCPDCHAKLDRVVTLVLEAHGVNADAPGGADRPAPGGSDSAAEITFDDGGDDAGADAGRIPPAPDVDAPDDPDAREGSAEDADANADAGVDVIPGPSTEDASAAGGTPPDESDGADGSDASAAGGTEGDEEREDDDATESAPSGGLRRLGDSGTSQYRKALRLLQNREFPMPRSDLVDVMASAYGLSHDECERIVDFAVDRGWLVDDGGVLRRD